MAHKVWTLFKSEISELLTIACNILFQNCFSGQETKVGKCDDSV